MLGHLRVSNLGVIQEAAIEPSEGLTVITGETGAGKTLLLGGLRLLLGERPDSSAVGPAGDSAQADGLFSSGEDEIGVTRVVPKDGRSRAHLDGSIVSAATLADTVGTLVEIVGQHEQLGLRRPSQILSLVDGALDEEGLVCLETYRARWEELQTVRRRQSELGGNEMALRQELDLVRFQASEIDAAGLEPGEDQRLENEASRHQNLEEIQELFAEAVRIGDTLVESGGELVSRARCLAGLDQSNKSLEEQAESVAAMVSELTRDIRDRAEGLELDPRRSEEVAQRLNLIGDLKRKYGPSAADVIEFGRRVSSRADELQDLLERADQIESDLTAAMGEVETAAANLSLARRAAATRIAEEARSHLADLGLEQSALALDLTDADAGPSGADRADLVFSSHSKLEPGPISSVASGGELSRLVLAVRLATRSPGSETLVFDEVDAGVGGVTALAMGRKLAELARSSQVLCVTHLPQLAAFADTHYVVERENGVATVRLVSGEERIQEISRMLAGLPESEAGQEAAAELLSAASSAI